MKIAFRMAATTPIDLEELVIDNSESKASEEAAAVEAPESPEAAEAAEEEAPEAEEAKGKPEKKKRERQIAIPTDSVTFFRARAKNLKMFGFTPDGNLQVPEMRGQPAKVIELPYYRPATSEEISLDEQQRAEKLQGVEREFDETYKLLRAAILEWRQTGFSSDVIRFQRDLQRLDAQRTQLRSPLRWTRAYKNLDTNKLLLEEIYEKRKVGYPVFALQSRIAFETMIRAGKKPVDEVKEVEVEAEDEAEAEGEEEEEFIVFSKPDGVHGFLSPDTMVEFIYNSTKYNCVIQAYEGERLTLLGRKDIRPVLLKTRNPKMMRIIGEKVTGQIENPREVLINILKALVTQHPTIGDSLRETGTATLVFAEIKDGALGVGMLPADPQITERAEWKGKNYLGQAWAAVREGLPAKEEEEEEGAEVPTVQKGGYTEHGTTRKEATEVRRNVLKGYYRHKKSFT